MPFPDATTPHIDPGTSTVACKYCGEPTAMTATKECDPCHETAKGLRSFLSGPRGRSLALQLLAGPGTGMEDRRRRLNEQLARFKDGEYPVQIIADAWEDGRHFGKMELGNEVARIIKDNATGVD